jgi:uncharacterized protein (UPF0333 family)
MNKRGQAAMEFLMTYGWAIVVVLAAIGALAYFGVLSPEKLLPDRTTFSAPIPNVDNAVVRLSGNSVEVAFRNNKGIAISIPRTSNFTSAQCTNVPVMTVSDTTGADIPIGQAIQNGAGFNVKWTCTPAAGSVTGSKFKADVSFNYINTETGQIIPQTGTIEGKFGG